MVLAGFQAAEAATGGAGSKPLMLDLSAHFVENFLGPENTKGRFRDIAGPRTFDGVPFEMDGRATLYGKEVELARGTRRADAPDILGIKVGRSFDELHLLHAAHWSDVEGMAIARLQLNYSDGTRRVMDIGYGVHVRDWQRLHSEEHESVTDPTTKVIWRGAGVENFRSSQRVFKSVLMNPVPTKRVDTIDFVSTGQIASYDIYAATVVDSDSERPVTPPVPLDRPERIFNGRINVRVLDPLDRPLKGVRIYPDLSVPGSNWATVGTPLYTSAEGTGIVKFPTDKTWCIIFHASKKGWHAVSEQMTLGEPAEPSSGLVVTIHLSPDSDTETDQRLAGEKSATPSATPESSANTTDPTPKDTAAEAPAETANSNNSQTFRPSPILLIPAPLGSTVRIEYSDTLAEGDWKLLTTITTTSSPFAFVCGQEEGPLPPRRFYRAAITPK